MAPEQHLGEAADARSDQYAFCVSLYEGFFEQRPFVGTTLRELAASKVRNEPLPPRRHPIPRGVTRVVLRGLQSDRTRRFPSMTALLEALEDAARPRYRRAFVAGLALTVAGGSAAVAWSMHGDDHEAAACPAAAERLAGVWDSSRADALHDTISSSGLAYAEDSWPRLRGHLDRYADEWSSAYDRVCSDRSASVADVALLDRRMACLDRRRDELHSIVEVLERGEGKAIQNAIGAVTGLRPIAGCEDPSDALPHDAEGRIATEEIRRALLEAESLGTVARYDEALALATPALERTRALELPALEAEAMLMLGRIHKGKGEAPQAEALLSKAALLASSLGRDEVAARAAIELVDVLGSWQSRAEEALEWNRHASAATVRLGTPPELEAARLAALGTLQLTLGHSDQSIAEFERGMALVRQTSGEEHPSYAIAQSNLGNALVRAGRFDEGLVTGREALAAGERAFGPRHPRVGIMHSFLSNAWLRQGDYAKAAEHARRALEILTDALGREHPNVAAIAVNLGQVEQRLGRLDAAAATFEAALPLVEGTPNETIVLASLSNVATEQRRFPTALAYAQRSRERREALFGPEDTRVAIGLVIEGETLARVGRDREAFAAFARARTIAQVQPLPAPAQIALTATRAAMPRPCRSSRPRSPSSSASSPSRSRWPTFASSWCRRCGRSGATTTRRHSCDGSWKSSRRSARRWSIAVSRSARGSSAKGSSRSRAPPVDRGLHREAPRQSSSTSSVSIFTTVSPGSRSTDNVTLLPAALSSTAV
jgi:tetratricopeptide (TPR) repeat protein